MRDPFIPIITVTHVHFSFKERKKKLRLLSKIQCYVSKQIVDKVKRINLSYIAGMGNGACPVKSDNLPTLSDVDLRGGKINFQNPLY